VLVGCGSGDNDPSGNYRGSVVNRVNGCHFEGWVEDKTMTMVVLSIVKDAGTDWLYAELYGLDPALVLNVLGTVRFEGRVEGDESVVVEFTPGSDGSGNPFEPHQLAFDTSGYVQMELQGLDSAPAEE